MLQDDPGPMAPGGDVMEQQQDSLLDEVSLGFPAPPGEEGLLEPKLTSSSGLMSDSVPLLAQDSAMPVEPLTVDSVASSGQSVEHLTGMAQTAGSTTLMTEASVDDVTMESDEQEGGMEVDSPSTATAPADFAEEIAPPVSSGSPGEGYDDVDTALNAPPSTIENIAEAESKLAPEAEAEPEVSSLDEDKQLEEKSREATEEQTELPETEDVPSSEQTQLSIGESEEPAISNEPDIVPPVS